MLIIFVYATILFVYYILLKYHIPVNSSHQNSSKSCFGLVLLGSPLSRTQPLQWRCKSWEQLGVSDSRGWHRQGGLLRFYSQAPREKDPECGAMQHPPIGQAEPYATVISRRHGGALQKSAKNGSSCRERRKTQTSQRTKRSSLEPLSAPHWNEGLGGILLKCVPTHSVHLRKTVISLEFFFFFSAPAVSLD